jgi:ubiquinone/menaquinone biosynthesis C-methylase UbiE
MYRSGTYLLDPHFIFDKAHLREGMIVADLGCGRTGHFTFPMAKRVGENGKIYAVDVLKDVLHNIENRKADHGVQNVHTVWSDLEQVGGTVIPQKSLDMAFIINTLLASPNKDEFLQETSRLMKPKSRLIVVDWTHNNSMSGNFFDNALDFESLANWARYNNFVVQDKFLAGPYHLGYVFFKHE